MTDQELYVAIEELKAKAAKLQREINSLIQEHEARRKKKR